MTTRTSPLLGLLTMALLLFLTLLVMAAPALAETALLPDTAAELAMDLDAQLAERLGVLDGPVKDQTLVLTTPVSVDDLELVSPLSRAMTEELAAWFVRMGYKVQEVRKGRNLLFAPGRGELLLTRRQELLDQKNIRAALILTGTYAVTRRAVRLHLRLIHAPSNEVLAMSTATIPLTRDLREMAGTGQNAAVAPETGAVATSFGTYPGMQTAAMGAPRNLGSSTPLSPMARRQYGPPERIANPATETDFFSLPENLGL